MDTILAYGATGECVVKLTALARAAGIDVAQFTDHQVLDDQAINAILTSLGVGDAGERTLPANAVYKGLLVDQDVWDALRAAAAANTGLAVPSPQGADVPPATGDGSQVPAPGQSGPIAPAASTRTPSPQGAEAAS